MPFRLVLTAIWQWWLGVESDYQRRSPSSFVR